MNPLSAPFASFGQDDISLFFQAYEEMDSPIFLSDSRGRVRWYNRAMEDFFGFKGSDPTGMEVRQFFRTCIVPHLRDDGSFISDVVKAVENGETIERITCHLVPEKGQGRWWTFSSTPILSGVLYGGRMNVFSDVTERRRGEEEIQQRNELEALVSEISTAFVGISSGDLDAVVRRSLRALGEFSGMDHCYLYIMGEDGLENGWEYVWSADESAITPALAGVAVYNFPWAAETALQQEAIRRIHSGGSRQSIVIPLQGRSMRGFLGFDGPAEEACSSGSGATLLRLTGGIFINALERSRVEETLRRHDAICEAVMTASGRFLRTSQWEGIIDDVLARLGTGGELSRIYLLGDLAEEHGSRVVHQWAHPEASPLPASNLETAVPWEGRGMEQWNAALALGHVIAANVRDLPSPLRASFVERSVLSFVIVPIFAGDCCWGYMGFEDCVRERRWTKPEIDALKTAADSLGSTIYRKEREGEIQRHNRQLMLINEIVGAAGSSTTLDELLRTTLSQTLDIFGLENGAVYLLNPEMNAAEIRCTAGRGADTTEFPPVLSPDWAAYHLLFVEGLIAFDGVAEADPAGLMPEITWMPLTGAGKVVGAMALSRRQGRRFSPDEKTALGAVGKEIGTAIVRATLQQELVESHEKANLYLDIMSHDIKNANTVSIMYADMLRENLEGERKEFAQKLMQSIRRSIEITDHVSTIRRLHQERVVLREVDLDAVIRKEIERFEGYRIHYSRSSFMVCADNLVTEIFANLIGNAVKFGGDEVEIFIRLEARNGMVEVTMEDTGPGIPDGTKTLIFDRFQRGSKKASGKGLGLYIVRTLVERYGGQIRVQDRVPGHPEQGVSFRFTLRQAPVTNEFSDFSPGS